MSDLPEMPCQELVERVTDYLDGALDPVDRARLEEHLDACAHCALYLEQLRETLVLAGELREEDVSPAMQRELLATFAAFKRERGL